MLFPKKLQKLSSGSMLYPQIPLYKTQANFDFCFKFLPPSAKYWLHACQQLTKLHWLNKIANKSFLILLRLASENRAEPKPYFKKLQPRSKSQKLTVDMKNKRSGARTGAMPFFHRLRSPGNKLTSLALISCYIPLLIKKSLSI